MNLICVRFNDEIKRRLLDCSLVEKGSKNRDKVEDVIGLEISFTSVKEKIKKLEIHEESSKENLKHKHLKVFEK